jgi:seryl-tRNA synthetase
MPSPRTNGKWLWIVLAAMTVFPAMAQRKTKQKAATATPTAVVAALKSQIKELTVERDGLKAKIANLGDLPEEMASALRSRDLARQEAEASKRELDQFKSSLKENQKGGDTLLKDLHQSRKELAECKTQSEVLKQQLDKANSMLTGTSIQEGALVTITPEVTPARPLNLNRVTPRVKKVGPAVVVVNVLISENGDVLDTRLLQGLPGDNEWVTKAHEACLEAAKRLVFDPARTGEAKIRVKVWQGVGFYLD